MGICVRYLLINVCAIINRFIFSSRYERHAGKDRKPKPEKKWNDKSRRRLWVRTMRREAIHGRSNSSSGQGMLDRVKSGLATIHNARLKIEQTMKSDPDSVSASKRNDLIISVRKNVEDISQMLQQAEQQQGTSNNSSKCSTISVLQKLRRDCEKEKDAIEAALQQNQKSQSQGQAPGFRDRSATVNALALEDGNEPQFTRLNAGNKTGSFIMPKANTPPVTVFGNNNLNKGNNPAAPNLGRNGAVMGTAVTGGASTASAKIAAVQGGKGANTFSLDKLVASNSDLTPDDIRDGHYMSETLQTKLIEQKLMGKDEATVMQELIDERNLAIDEVSVYIYVCMRDMYIYTLLI